MSPFGHEADVPMQLQHVCYQGGSTETVAAKLREGTLGAKKSLLAPGQATTRCQAVRSPTLNRGQADRMMLLPGQ
jgi:hypothetical protein